MLKRLTPSLLYVLLLLAPLGSFAAEAPNILAHVEQMSDSEVDRRLAFLEEHLDSGRDYAWYWWHGWTAFYGTGVVVQSVRAGLSDTKGERADYIVSAVKAAGGVTGLLLRPLAAKDGADSVRALPGKTPAERRAQLALAETQLQTNADVSDNRFNWLRHALNVGINTAGALIVWKGFDDRTRAWRSAGIGIAVGEVALWSQPWWPANDWEEYQRRFARAPQPVAWHVAPNGTGLALQVTF